ncbi:MAG TPA: N-acetylmuramoyl-L-alanine amidase [Beijerinckiaceae bacterium]|nr:N-acetylmuramoyl-L-alanine amidase [Beijerinckiaceae bacterium]
MAKVKNHKIDGAKNSIIDTSGTLSNPKYLVCHFTGGSTVQSSLDTLKAKGTSYHVLIDRDGTIHQVAPFNVRAAHAGVSNWKGIDGLNEHSIGISLANYGGYLKPLPGKVWRAPGGEELPESRVLVAEHHIGLTQKIAWERFPPAQIAAAIDVIKAVLAAYPSIKDAMGHDEVAMGRREDPGPSFPWADVHALFAARTDFGPVVTVQSPDGSASLRKGRSSSSPELAKLPNGTRLHARSVNYTYVTNAKGEKVPVKHNWVSVARHNTMAHAGFVARGLLTPQP